MTLPLTERQEELWRFLKSCQRSPTYEEMAQALGYTCRGQRVADLVDALILKGFARKIKGGSRNIIPIDPNEAVLTTTPTSDLLAELERRGILLGLPS